MNAIETRGLTKDFGQGRGIFDLDLVVETGRVHGFLGPNGAGKTTVLRMLMDYLRPTHGAARVLGMDPTVDAKAIRARVGFVPGELALPAGVTGHEFLDHSARLRGGVDRARRDELIDLLDAQPEQRMGTLSKGNKQKIALIDALQHAPELLIMDEPTDGLDPLLRDRIREILRIHAKGGGTVFLSSHVVHEIQTVCDEVSIVLRGRLRSQATIKDLVAREGLVVEADVDDAEATSIALKRLGAVELETNGNRVRFRVRGDPLPALAALHQHGGRAPQLRQGDLEDHFLAMYAEDAQ